MTPSWVVDTAIALLKAGAKLVQAESDEEREAALMEAAEATKAALDRQKFGV